MRITQLGWDSLRDRFGFDEVDANELMPIELDDEYITGTFIGTQPLNQPSLTTGFNALNQINNAIVSATKEDEIPLCEGIGLELVPKECLGKCECGRSIRAVPLKRTLDLRLRKLKYLLDDLPSQLGTWKDQQVGTQDDELRYLQYEILRANVHVTHIWAQSVLFERLVTLCNDSADETYSADRIWDFKEDLCRQLFYVADNISLEGLRANGMALVSMSSGESRCRHRMDLSVTVKSQREHHNFPSTERLTLVSGVQDPTSCSKSTRMPS